MSKNGSRKPPSDGDYEVGYGKPPRSGQFKPGNPGRPKRNAAQPKGLTGADIVQQVLNRRVRVKRGDQTIKMGVAELFSERLLTIFTRGTAREMAVFLGYMERNMPAPKATQEPLDVYYHHAPGSTVPLPPRDEPPEDEQ